MKSATLQLIELAEHLNPTGVIGDGTVATFHELAARARLEQGPAPAVEPFSCSAPYGETASGRPRELHECDGVVESLRPMLADRENARRVVSRPNYAALGIGDPESRN